MTKKNILIVDDEFEICMLLSSFLKSKGYNATYVNTIKEGNILLDDYTPYITFLDINLPDGLGFELVPKIKANSEAKVIVISAREGADEKELSKKYMVDDYITKPFTRNDIINSIEKITQS